MKTKLVLLLSVILITSSCKKFKKPSACIDGPTEAEVGESVTYTWCGDNADEISWSDSHGNSGSGKTFTTTFDYRSTFTILAIGKNKYRRGGEEAQLQVECGRKSYIWCSISNYCIDGNTIYNTSDLANYKAYLYPSKEDWVNDVKNKNHARCVDSVTCSYSQVHNSTGAYFKKTLSNGSIAFVSIEYRNPEDPSKLLSNWGELFTNSSSGLININNQEFSDNTGYTSLADVAKKILYGKWKLTKAEINSIPVTPSACNLDDYIRLYADGTWKYFIGEDDCNGNSSESLGTFDASLQRCTKNGDFGISMSTSSGPFSGISNSYFSDNFTKFQISFSSGSNSGTYEFTYAP